jgi:hypothetical protein
MIRKFSFLRTFLPLFIIDFFLLFFAFFLGVLRRPKGINIECLIKNKTSSSCYVFATGPSIQHFDIKKLAGKDCFSLSNFYLHKDIKLINPIAHFIAAYHKPLQKKNFIDWINDIDSKLPKRTILITDSRNKILFQKSKIKSRKIIYIPTFPFNYIIFISRFGSQIRPWSIPILAIPVLYLVGYKKINLVGCDHTSLRNYKDDIKNFYSRTKDVRKRTTDKSHWNSTNIINVLQNELMLFNQYKSLNLFLRKRNVRIINLSNDSWLDFL